MKAWTIALVVAMFALELHAIPPIQRTVTNEDIRDAILSVVHMLRSLEDKLVRHEFREKALGETIKKTLASTEKRIRTLEPVKGTVSRLDERLANVETILIQKEEKERSQLQKTVDAIEDIQSNLPTVMNKLKSDIIEKLPVAPSLDEFTKKGDLEKTQKALVEKLDNVTKNTEKLESEISKIRTDNEAYKTGIAKSTESFDRVKKQLGSSELLLEKYDHQMKELSDKIVSDACSGKQNEWKESFFKALSNQTADVKSLATDVKTITAKVNDLPAKSDLESFENSTTDSFEQLKYQVASQTEKSAIILDAKLKTLSTDNEKRHDDVIKSILDLGVITETLTENSGNSYEHLKTEIAGLSKLEQVMMQTADSVIDTKRRVEYGVHQISLEVSNLIKNHSEILNNTINDRFNTFELSVLDDDNGALANITTKIGDEIVQVWRQIGIMHQQMRSSSDTLNKLQNQTDSYVTGSLDAMGNMKGKVGQITGRINEVNENLNYLMGRLSLVSQEFNNIKTGLSTALDQIRGSFHAVQDKLKRSGPGPHQLASNELDDTNNINGDVK